MGKSLGNVLEPEKLVGAYGADAVRYYFMSQIPFGLDGDFAEASGLGTDQRFQCDVPPGDLRASPRGEGGVTLSLWEGCCIRPSTGLLPTRCT